MTESVLLLYSYDTNKPKKYLKTLKNITYTDNAAVISENKLLTPIL